jgi:hypothetical protein
MTYVIDQSPVDGSSWLLSMFFVLIVTMIKQAYEDYLRHQNDRRDGVLNTYDYFGQFFKT